MIGAGVFLEIAALMGELLREWGKGKKQEHRGLMWPSVSRLGRMLAVQGESKEFNEERILT